MVHSQIITSVGVVFNSKWQDLTAFKISSDFTLISISPVGLFGFLFSLSTTSPLILITILAPASLPESKVQHQYPY